jgi:choline dehydrogenase-like flavoprotein
MAVIILEYFVVYLPKPRLVYERRRNSPTVNTFFFFALLGDVLVRVFLVDPVLNRRNLFIFSQALVTKINVTSAGSGRVSASGVQVRFPDGSIQFAKAKGEVILSAGTVRTPQLLELSGIGDPKVLNPLGINVKVDLPGVGANYEDQ